MFACQDGVGHNQSITNYLGWEGKEVVLWAGKDGVLWEGKDGLIWEGKDGVL